MKKALNYLLLIFFIALFPTSNAIGQTNKFNTLQKYDIKGISINDTFICDLNGFTHGTIDYGIYKQRGFYFAIKHDNAKLGNNISILESISHSNFTTDAGFKGIQYDLIELGNNNNILKAKFWETKDFVYFMLTSNQNGQKIEMVYILIPQ